MDIHQIYLQFKPNLLYVWSPLLGEQIQIN